MEEISRNDICYMAGDVIAAIEIYSSDFDAFSSSVLGMPYYCFIHIV
jgi:hypothetical protein